jgi:hypothetical protein
MAMVKGASRRDVRNTQPYDRCSRTLRAASRPGATDA